MANKCQIYLVPGFFGFSSIGAYSYFYRVGETLEKYLRTQHHLEAEIISCPTQATSSIRRRSQVVLQKVKESGGQDASSMHFIGHSTGALDVRLLLSQGVTLRDDGVEKQIAKKTKTAVSISAPHFGTPLASFFTTLQGRHILQLITSLAHHQNGRKSLFWLSKALTAVAKVDNWVRKDQTFLDLLVARLLQHVTLEPDDPIWSFLEDMKNDQGAIIQLTPEGMHLFNAAVVNQPNIDYCTVATVTHKPTTRDIAHQLPSPTAAASNLLYTFLYTVTSRQHKHYPYPSPSVQSIELLSHHLPFPVTTRSNDGIAPVLSQLHGTLLDIIIADHLDIVGQFDHAGDNLFTDWLVSGAGFNEQAFNTVWAKIGDRIASNEKA